MRVGKSAKVKKLTSNTGVGADGGVTIVWNYSHMVTEICQVKDWTAQGLH